MLSLLGSFLFYQIQSRIGDEQKMRRMQFVKENPHLEYYFKKSYYYNQYIPPDIKNNQKNLPGMTNEQKKSF